MKGKLVRNSSYIPDQPKEEYNVKILVTGAGGFVGKYLLSTLLEHKHDVTAIGINNGSFLNDMGIAVHVVNITDYDVLYETMKNEMPDAVIHLAAISNIPLSWTSPALTINVNVNGSINVFNALQAVNPKAKFLFILPIKGKEKE